MAPGAALTAPGSGTDRAAERPQYMRIRDILRERIRAGEYPIDSFLPTEGELCEAFSTSRHTVREALRHLTDDGLIQRRQGSGSRVIATEPHHTYVHSMRSLDELFQYARETRFQIDSVRREVPKAAPAVGLGVADGCPWLVVRGLRLEHGENVPICESIVYVHDDFSGIADELKTDGSSIYRRIGDRYDVEVAEVVQDIVVVPMPARAARVLGVKRPALAVQVSRRYLDAADKLLLASVNFHPTDRFYYSMHLRRDGRSSARE